MQSHPEWVRGLKLIIKQLVVYECKVAPRVGAWIETALAEAGLEGVHVAPLVGAWIETG